VSRAKDYRKLAERIEATVEYRVDVAALRFVDEVVRCMQQRGITQADLARRIDASQPYVCKVLRGDTNFTLTTMVKLADALGQDLHLHLSVPGAVVHWRDVITSPQEPVEMPRQTVVRQVRVDVRTIGREHAEAPVAA